MLKINVDLMLHRARCARWEALRSTDFRARKALLQTSESRFRKCIEMDPQDGRAYVGLAKLIEKARRVRALAVARTGAQKHTAEPCEPVAVVAKICSAEVRLRVLASTVVRSVQMFIVHL